MEYRKTRRVDADISLLSMGGHEYLPSGRSRGFNEQFDLAVTPGHIFEGFGGEQRRETLHIAYESGLNLFDVTQDSEKAALGRNLKEMPPPYPFYVQTRPEGMVYTYDPHNRSLLVYAKLKAEVQRGLALLQRERLDFLNLGIMRDALDHDPQYLDKLGDNIARLKQEGLIRWAAADTFSGEPVFMAQIECGHFDAVNINFNFADHFATERVLPAAAAAGIAVFVREAFMKSDLFRMGEEVGITDRALLAAVGIKFCLAPPQVTSLTVGTNNPGHLRRNIAVLDQPHMTDAEREAMARVKTSRLFAEYEAGKRKQWRGES